MARKTLKKGGSHHKKNAKKGGSHHKKTAKKGGSHHKKGGMDDYIPEPGLMTKAYRMAANAIGHKTKGQKGAEEYAQIVAKRRADEEALAKKIAENEKIIAEDNNPEIKGRTIYSMVIKKENTPEELTEEEKNLIENGHFYQYSDYDMRLIDLGKATKVGMEYGQQVQGTLTYMVQFCNDGDCSFTDVAYGSKNYTFRYKLPSPPAPPAMTEQPGGYLKKNKDSKKSKANKGSKKNKKSPK